MNFDLTVIGSGPGGYTAAVRASQLGFKTALVERYSRLGGTCLNVGCIPSKTLLHSSELYYNTKHRLEIHGIGTGEVSVNWERMMERKRSVIDAAGKGLDFLMKKNKISVINGSASFIDSKTLAIKSADGSEKQLKSTYCIIATGSEATDLPNASFDKDRILSSTQVLDLKKIPKTLLIVGAGVIGLELGSIYAHLGTRITVIEYLSQCIPGMDNELGVRLEQSFRDLDVTFHFGHRIRSAVNKNNMVTVTTGTKDGQSHAFDAEYCLIAAGRRPRSSGLNLENAGVRLTEKGFVKTDEWLKTDADTVYAIGDVTGSPMLAHKAEEEGVFVAERLAGQKPHINYSHIPSIVYTHPEVASVGLSEEQAKQNGISYKMGKFPFSALGRAKASDDLEGFVKIIADKTTDEILGVHIVGERASDLIAEAVTAMAFRASAEDIARICHGHPTYSESLREAALIATDNRPLNF